MNSEENALIWSEDFKIHSYDVDFARRATLEALCRCFLEAAWNHAEQLGVGYTQLQQQGRFWVLARLLMRIATCPSWGEKVTLLTWPRDTKTIFALRDFQMMTPSGAHLASGTSSWLVLDANSKRPQRTEKLLTSMPTLPNKSAVGQDAPKLAALPAGNATLTAGVRYSDLDVNRHVNSGRYIGWLMDSYPLDFHQTHSPALLEVNYVGETLGGETVSVMTQQTQPEEFQHGVLKAQGEEVCRARVVWTRNL